MSIEFVLDLCKFKLCDIHKMSSLFICYDIFLQLEPYMTEEFIHHAFSEMGETIAGVKMIWNSKTG